MNMTGEQLTAARKAMNIEQQQAAARLKVSQPYLSLLESGKRPVTESLAKRAVRAFGLSPTALPVATPSGVRGLAFQLAALGYPKFAHLKKPSRLNPASVLATALETDELESRVVEALPWLILTFHDLDWPHVVRAAKLADAQNRLGFLLALARAKARLGRDSEVVRKFDKLLTNLDGSRLLNDDSFRRQTLTNAERNWLKSNRPPLARQWRMLTNLTAEVV